MADKRVIKKPFAHIHKLAAIVSMVGFLVTILGGVMSGARIMTIVFRSLAVILVVGVVSRVIIRILSTYEELNSGKA